MYSTKKELYWEALKLKFPETRVKIMVNILYEQTPLNA